MGVLTLPVLPTLGRTWTHRKAVSEAMVLTNTVDNEKIQTSNVRAHLNMAISTIVEQLELNADPFYGIIYRCEIEDSLNDAGVHWIDLATNIPFSAHIPIQNLSKVERVSCHNSNDTVQNPYVGNFSRKDIAEIVHLGNNLNVQHRDSIYWTMYGPQILLFVGDNIATSVNGKTDTAYILPEKQIAIFGIRQPMLDDLLSIAIDPTNIIVGVQSATFDNVIDLPDRYIKLAIALTQKFILEQLEKTIPQQLEQSIEMQFRKANQDVQQELQTEKARREKIQYGQQNK